MKNDGDEEGGEEVESGFDDDSAFAFGYGRSWNMWMFV